MLRSSVLTVLSCLLTVPMVPSLAASAENPPEAWQRFRVCIPGEIRIVATNPDRDDIAQAVRISAGIDVSVSLQNMRPAKPESATMNVLIREGQTITLPISQRIDSNGRRSLPQLLILPGW